MKLSKKSAWAAMLLAISMGACACSTPAKADPMEDAVSYTCESGEFTIQVPGKWVDNSSESRNTQSIVLDDDNQTLTIMVQRYPKEDAEKNLGATDLESFTPIYKEIALSGLIAVAEEPTAQELTIEGMTAASAEEYTATQDGNISKAYIALMESEQAFYSYTITGIEKNYDKNIETLKLTIKTLTEK